VAGRIGLLESPHPLDKGLHSPLLKDTHQRRSESLPRIGWHLSNRGFWPISLLNIAARNLLELEVSCYVCRNQDIRQFTARHEEFWHEINVPVIHSSILLPWFFAFVVVAIFLEELGTVSLIFLDR
jgi:hypothetical protein